MSRTLKSRLNFPYRRHTISAASSREALFAIESPATPTSLSFLSKRPATVECPYCRTVATTKVRTSDSTTTKVAHAVLWAGMADPFALTTFNWFQDVDHYCGECEGHLVRKPYRRATEVIPEEDVLSLVGATEEREGPNLNGDTMQPEPSRTTIKNEESSRNDQQHGWVQRRSKAPACMPLRQTVQQESTQEWPQVPQHDLEPEIWKQRGDHNQHRPKEPVREVNLIAA